MSVVADGDYDHILVDAYAPSQPSPSYPSPPLLPPFKRQDTVDMGVCLGGTPLASAPHPQKKRSRHKREAVRHRGTEAERGRERWRS